MPIEQERYRPPSGRPEGGFLARVIHVEMDDAHAVGLDQLGATQRAVQVVMAVRPDLSASEALKLVEWVSQ
ncbi:hypothetical protein [Magnetospirillum sp. 15-1]|uniref:hypothetical protein n=1 Tax=Magnetospirillum sp. 15-1 TaxID=1979370 RepID=UPI000BBCDBCA|nr:hypothetical protein [Magnetospirillum sp. 15-1]